MYLELFCKKVQNEKGYAISCIRNDHGGEFENHAFENFCNDFVMILALSINFHHLGLHNKLKL